MFGVGWIGVDVFFAISGYVITASAIRQMDSPDYAAYFWRARLARILPLYYFTTAVYLVVVSAEALKTDASFQILSHLFLIHNFFQNTAASINGVTWSLSLELQFYILAFFIVPLIARAARSTLIAGCVAMFSVVLIYRLASWYWLSQAGATDADFMLAFTQVPARIDSFALGGLICLLSLDQPNRTQAVLLALVAFVLLTAIYFVYTANALSYWASWSVPVILGGLVALFAAVALLSAMSLPPSIRWGPMLALGKISYGIYLWHLIVLHLVQRYLSGGGWTAALATVALTLALAKLSHLTIEMPFMRWAHNARRTSVA